MNPDPQYAVFLKGKVLEGCLSCDDRESGQDPDSAVLSYLGLEESEVCGGDAA